MKFSVLINNYNHDRFVCEAVESALRQSHPPHEVIVVDDSSTDGSWETLCAAYGGNPAVKLLQQPNSGQLASIANALRHATGDVMALLDADDFYEPGYLERLAALYGGRPDIDCVFCHYQTLGGERLSNPVPEWMERAAAAGGGGYDLGYTASLCYFRGKPSWLGNATSCCSIRASMTGVLALEEIIRRWRFSNHADYVILAGVSLCGGRKYFLAQKWVNYRVHGGNHSMHRTAVYQWAHGAVRQVTYHFYRSRVSLGNDAEARLKEEMATVPEMAPEHRALYDKVLEKVRQRQKPGHLAALEKRFAALEKRLAAMEGQLAKTPLIEKRLARLEQRGATHYLRSLFYEKHQNHDGVKRRFCLLGISLVSVQTSPERRRWRVLGIPFQTRRRPAP